MLHGRVVTNYVRQTLSVSYMILLSWLSVCQKLSNLAEVWRSSDKNKFGHFFGPPFMYFVVQLSLIQRCWLLGEKVIQPMQRTTSAIFCTTWFHFGYSSEDAGYSHTLEFCYHFSYYQSARKRQFSGGLMFWWYLFLFFIAQSSSCVDRTACNFAQYSELRSVLLFGSKILREPPKKILGQKHAKFGPISIDFKVRRRISSKRMKI